MYQTLVIIGDKLILFVEDVSTTAVVSSNRVLFQIQCIQTTHFSKSYDILDLEKYRIFSYILVKQPQLELLLVARS
jgi:hypothetical protein